MTEDLQHHDADLDEAPDTVNAEAVAALSKEVRFGLTLLGLLLAMLAAALYVKLGYPGLHRGEHSVADVGTEESAVAPAAQSLATEQTPAAEPVQVPAYEDTSDAKSRWTRDRYASRHDPAPPDDEPLPIGSANEIPDVAAPPATNPFATQIAQETNVPGPIDQVSAEAEVPPLAPTAAGEGPSAAAAPFAATSAAESMSEPALTPAGATSGEQAANPFAAAENELPADAPAAEGPLVPTEEVELQPHAPQQSGDIQPAGAKEPTMAEPRNAPYGRPQPHDRYAQVPPAGTHGVEGPRAAPSAEHTPLHTIPNQHPGAPHAATANDPYATPLERELQHARTPQYGTPQHTPGAAPLNQLDAPAAEFAAPHDNVSGHHQPTHTPTPDGTYTVGPNDSFWTISQKVYGTGSYFKAVQRHNRKPGANADGLEIGERILVPPVEELEHKYPQLCPKRRAPAQHGGQMHPASTSGHGYGGRVYVVEEGDTLFDIARYELGKASRWAEIYDLNRAQLGSDYNYVAPGTKLVLPGDQMNQDAITTRPGAQYPR